MTRLPFSPYSKRGRRHSIVTRSPSGFHAGITFLRQRIAAVVPGLKAHSDSRLQRRLDQSLKRDKVFFELVRQKRAERLNGGANESSWLSAQLSERRSEQPWRFGAVALVLGLSLGGSVWTSLFINEQVTLMGIPYRVVDKFWQSEAARNAYFGGDSQALHDELVSLGVEEDIKSYYRDRYGDRFSNDYELDRHIHQLMFDRTGYVGEAYKVNNYGRLVSRKK